MNIRLLAAVAIASAMSFSAVGAESLNVWGGGNPETSAYSGVYVPRVIEVLEENRMAGYTWGGTTAGTVENAQRVTVNPTDLAVGQYDILKNLNGQPIPGQPTLTYKFNFILGADGNPANLGPECLYIVTNQKGFANFGHVLGDAWNITLATGAEGSGSLATFNNLQRLYPDLNDVQLVNAGGAGDIVSAILAGEATHGFFVQRPDPNNDVFKTIKDKGLTIVPVIDIGLDADYEFKSLKVANGGLFEAPVVVDTACTSVALITGDKSNIDPTDTRSARRIDATIERLNEAIKANAEVLRPNLATWRDMFDSIKDIGSDKLKELFDASVEGLNEAAQKLGN